MKKTPLIKGLILFILLLVSIAIAVFGHFLNFNYWLGVASGVLLCLSVFSSLGYYIYNKSIETMEAGNKAIHDLEEELKK